MKTPSLLTTTLLFTCALLAPLQAQFHDPFDSLDPTRWNAAVDGVTGSITAMPDGTVRLHQAAHYWGNLYASAGEHSHFYVQTDLLNSTDIGASWAPSLMLYYDADNWVQFGLRRTDKLQLRWSLGNHSATTEVAHDYSWSTSQWYTLRIEVNTPEQEIRLWIGEAGEPLTLLSTLTQPLPTTFTGESFIILGKGVGQTPYDANPFLRNSFTSAGSYGYSYYDNAVVATIPEPSALVLSGGGLLLAMIGLRRRLR